MAKVVVIKPNLKYRMKTTNKGRSFIPNVGDVLDLPIEIARKELNSGNVRKRLKEEMTPEERKAIKSTKKLNKKADGK